MRRILVHITSSDIKCYRNGQLRRVCTYINGDIRNRYWFYENGDLMCEHTYINGELVKKSMCIVL